MQFTFLDPCRRPFFFSDDPEIPCALSSPHGWGSSTLRPSSSPGGQWRYPGYFSPLMTVQLLLFLVKAASPPGVPGRIARSGLPLPLLLPTLGVWNPQVAIVRRKKNQRWGRSLQYPKQWQSWFLKHKTVIYHSKEKYLLQKINLLQKKAILHRYMNTKSLFAVLNRKKEDVCSFPNRHQPLPSFLQCHVMATATYAAAM